MIELSLEYVLSTVNNYVDDALADIALHTENRSPITMPSLISPQINSGNVKLYSFNTPISAVRETAIYSYLLKMMDQSILPVDKQSLLIVVKAMRKVPFVEYGSLASYHKLASQFYKQEGNQKKAELHAVFNLIDDAKQYLTDFKVEYEFGADDEELASFDGEEASCKVDGPSYDGEGPSYNVEAIPCNIERKLGPADYSEVLQILNRNTPRYQALLLYILRYISTHLKERSRIFQRPHYTLIEQALSAAVSQFAQDEHCDSDLRSCIYYYDSLYYELTNRIQKAALSRKQYQEIGGEKDYEQLCDTLLHQLPELLRSEKDFIDHVMLFNTDYDNDADVYLFDDYGLDDELPMQGLYRDQLMDTPFNHIYEEAEYDNPDAIREVVRCYREGDGVTACEAAAKAWESKL